MNRHEQVTICAHAAADAPGSRRPRLSLAVIVAVNRRRLIQPGLSLSMRLSLMS